MGQLTTNLTSLVKLSFSDNAGFIQAYMRTDNEVVIDAPGQWVIENLDTSVLHYHPNQDAAKDGDYMTILIGPRETLVVEGGRFTHGGLCLIVSVPPPDQVNLIGSVLSQRSAGITDKASRLKQLEANWFPYEGATYGQGLYRSVEDDLGGETVNNVPLGDMFQQSGLSDSGSFSFKVYLWWIAGRTNVGIHTHNEPPTVHNDDASTLNMAELHTQISGTGRMQRFYASDVTARYEEQRMHVGQVHQIMAYYYEKQINDHNFMYPWHQYYADTDAVWMVVEHYPA